MLVKFKCVLRKGIAYNFYIKFKIVNMPRGGSRGGSSRSSSPPPRSSFAATRPQPTQQAPMQQPTTQKTGMFSGIGSTIMQGMAFGAGSEVAHQAVRSVMGGSSHQQQAPQQVQQQQQQVQQNPCQA